MNSTWTFVGTFILFVTSHHKLLGFDSSNIIKVLIDAEGEDDFFELKDDVSVKN